MQRERRTMIERDFKSEADQIKDEWDRTVKLLWDVAHAAHELLMAENDKSPVVDQEGVRMKLVLALKALDKR